MNNGSYIFSQITALISHKQFQSIVDRHNGDYKVKDFSCWRQFLCMAFGQLTHRESLSDTLICLKANGDKMYHMGIGEVVAKSTLSKANENRSYRIYEDLAMLLIAEAKHLYLGDNNLAVEIKDNVFAIDATKIDLCLSGFLLGYFSQYKRGYQIAYATRFKNIYS